jgi:hypothetical protein
MDKKEKAPQRPGPFPFSFCLPVGRWGTASATNVSEIELQAELDQARSAIFGHLAESRAASVIVDPKKLGVVKGVEKLRSEFDQFALGDVGVFDDRSVEIIDSRAAKRIAP